MSSLFPVRESPGISNKIILIKTLTLNEYLRIITHMKKTMYVYIMTNVVHTVLYVGVTNDLIRRVWEHKNNILGGFTATYRLHKLVYFAVFEDANSAIAYEKYLKKCYRRTKEKLITEQNPKWRDLYEDLVPNE